MNRRLRIKNFKLEALILWNQKDRITKFKNTNTNIKSEFARKARSKTPIEPKYKIEKTTERGFNLFSPFCRIITPSKNIAK